MQKGEERVVGGLRATIKNKLQRVITVSKNKTWGGTNNGDSNFKTNQINCILN